MRIKKYQFPAGALNKRYTDKDFEGTGWHYIPRSDIKPDDKLLNSAQKQGEEYYLAGEDGYLLPSNIVNHFLKNKGLTTAYDYYYDQQNLSPFTKNLNKYFTQQYDANDRIGQQMRLRAADRKANRLAPGAGTFVVAPVAATLAGIGGATLAPFLAPGTIGGNIIGTTAFGEALNQAMKYGTGKTLGEHAVNAARYLGIPQNQWGDFGIQMIGDLPFYVTGDLIGKQVTNAGRTLTKEALDQLALDNTFKGISINPTTKDLAKAINTEVKNKQFTNLFPGQIGWAPRQTLTGYHASNKPIQEFNYWHPNWAVIEHDAPYGVYFTANETRPSGGFLAKRPYIEQVTSTFDRPMVQVGEISAAGKNATRNSIERQAQSMGADGIIYQGIKDNQLENQTIVKALNPDQRVDVSEIIENDPYQVTKILDKDKIRLRLPTHTKDLPREIVLEPQGNNQYRIHIRTWNGDHVPTNLDSKEKQALFESVYNELPEGAEILFPESSVDYPATRGTVAALTHLSRDPRFQRGNTTGTLIYTDKGGNLQTFTGNSFIKGQKFLDQALQGFTDNSSAQQNNISELVDRFINQDIIPRIQAQGHQIIRYKPNIREISPETDLIDAQMLNRDAGAWFMPSVNDVTIRGPLQNQDYGLLLHEIGGHGLRYNLQSDYRPTTRYYLNQYVAGNGNDPEIAKELLQVHTGTQPYTQVETKALQEGYPYVSTYFQLNPTKDPNKILNESGAVNTQFRAKISQRNGHVIGEDLNKAIDQTQDNIILKMLDEQPYTHRGFINYVQKLTGKDPDDLVFLSESDWEQLIKQYPELTNISKRVKAAMKTVGVSTGLGYGLSQLNQPTSNRKGGRLIPRKRYS